MRKDIQYRDLPGGPLMVKFADELPLCSLCSKCGMLSKDMFEDPSSHAFCSICIFECSDRKKIHCKYENKDVSVEEMMPAIDIINVVMDQVVFCPNTSDGNSCTKYCTLKDLEGHYLECEKTKIICLSCGDTVKGRDWKTHVTSCPQQIMQCCYCVVAVPRFRLELHERLCSYNPNAVREADTSPTAAMDFTSRQSSDWARNEKQLPVSVNTNKPHLIPEAKVKLATDATDAHMPRDLSKVDDDVLLSCPKCNRNVKSKNMDKHISVCTQRTNGPSSPEARQTPEIAPEVAAVASDMGSLLSSYEMLSVSDIPTEDDVTEHGHSSGVHQESGYSQMAASNIVQTQPSRSEEAPTEAPGSWSIWNYVDWGHFFGPRQGGGCSEMATGYIAGPQSSRTEETSGHCSEVGQEAGCLQMAASDSVQTQPSRPEETPTGAPGPWSSIWNYVSSIVPSWLGDDTSHQRPPECVMLDPMLYF